MEKMREMFICLDEPHSSQQLVVLESLSSALGKAGEELIYIHKLLKDSIICELSERKVEVLNFARNQYFKEFNKLRDQCTTEIEEMSKQLDQKKTFIRIAQQDLGHDMDEFCNYYESKITEKMETELIWKFGISVKNFHKAMQKIRNHIKSRTTNQAKNLKRKAFKESGLPLKKWVHARKIPAAREKTILPDPCVISQSTAKSAGRV